MVLVVVVLLLALLLGGLGFAVHILWWLALIVLALWLLGFVFRLGFGLCDQLFTEDETQVYLLGLRFHATHDWPAFGPDVVWTKSEIPGALQEAIDRMAPHDRPLFVGQLARLRQDFLWDADFSQVVQQPGHSEPAYVFRTESDELGQCHGQHAYVERVRGSVLVELLELQERDDDVTVAVHRDGE